MKNPVIVIPTMPERSVELFGLTSALRRAGDYDVHVSRHEESHKDVGNALRKARQAATGDWVMYLEDDVLLGSAFGVIPGVLERVKPQAGAVSFFSLQREPPSLQRLVVQGVELGVEYRSARRLMMVQCLCIRTELLDGFDEHALAWYAAHPTEAHAADPLIGDFIADKGYKLALVWPSLVQHRMGKSTLGPRSSKRQSPTFLE